MSLYMRDKVVIKVKENDKSVKNKEEMKNSF